MSDQLYICPACGRRGFTVRGLRAHICRVPGVPQRRLSDGEISGIIAQAAKGQLQLTVPLTWIPVGIDMPDAEITVLICTEDAKGPIHRECECGFWDGECWRYIDAAAVPDSLRVSHWADLPEPPSE